MVAQGGNPPGIRGSCRSCRGEHSEWVRSDAQCWKASALTFCQSIINKTFYSYITAQCKADVNLQTCGLLIVLQLIHLLVLVFASVAMTSFFLLIFFVLLFPLLFVVLFFTV